MSIHFGLVRRNPIPLFVLARGFQTTSSLSSAVEHWWGPERAAGREEVGHGALGDPVVNLTN